MSFFRKVIFSLLIGGLLAGCAVAPSPGMTPTPTQAAWTATSSQHPTQAPSPTSLPTHSATPVPSPTLTATPTPTQTATATPIPTYIKIRGEVIIEQAVCHYGPGAPYLYKYGVYKGSNLEILRRIAGGNYLEIQAIGGNNPCWVRMDYFKIKGDLANVEPVNIDQVKLPVSPYYAPPGGVSARRDGNVVTIFWKALALRAGDDSEQTPYIVEAWVCQGGQMVFVPAGTTQIAVKVTDEPGCALPSHAWFIAAEKHGYTRRVAVPWPAADAATPP
jgi:hypothetical protein